MKSRYSVLVTGANGFVGRALCQDLIDCGHEVKGAARHTAETSYERLGPDLCARSDWRYLLEKVQVVVHCAARVHQMEDKAADPLAEYRRINTEGTLNLARQAAQAGVSRFVFLSSVKVNGERTEPGHPFVERLISPPDNPYARSKYEAELGLLRLSTETGMEVVIIRLPLVYGTGVKANFARLINLAGLGIPLPLADIDNRRSLLSIENLCDFIRLVIEHPAAAGETFLIADSPSVSTPILMRQIAKASGKSCQLFDFPVFWLERIACLLGKKAALSRLTDSLELDCRKANSLLGWRPPVRMETALFNMFREFR